MKRKSNHSIAIIELFGDDKDTRIYRPRLNKVTGSPLGSILLQQIVYRWRGKGFSPFYKFNTPCSHKAYKEGDSWEEELGFTTAQLVTARKSIAVKLRSGSTPDYSAIHRPVVYWTDAARMTWYSVIEGKLLEWLGIAYHSETAVTALENQQHSGADKFQKLIGESTISTEANRRISDLLIGESTITYTKNTIQRNNIDIQYQPPEIITTPTLPGMGYIEPESDKIVIVNTALSAICKETLAMGFNEDKFNSAANALEGLGATPAKIAGFTAWWAKNGFYPGKPALISIVDNWQNYEAGITSNGNEANGRNGSGKANGRANHPQNRQLDAPIPKRKPAANFY